VLLCSVVLQRESERVIVPIQSWTTVHRWQLCELMIVRLIQFRDFCVSTRFTQRSAQYPAEYTGTRAVCLRRSNGQGALVDPLFKFHHQVCPAVLPSGNLIMLARREVGFTFTCGPIAAYVLRSGRLIARPHSQLLSSKRCQLQRFANPRMLCWILKCRTYIRFINLAWILVQDGLGSSHSWRE